MENIRQIFIRKSELPLAVVIEDNGQVRVMELAPAGKGKLGAFLKEASGLLREAVLKRLKK